MKRVLSVLLVLSVCSVYTFGGGQAEGADGDRAMIASMATDVGGLGDKSFNDGAYQGLERGADLGFEARVVESNQQTDYIPNLTGLAEDGSDIVFAVGFLMEEAVKESARQNPDTYFAGVDIGGDPNIPNFQGILYQEEQSGFLAGVVAAMLTSEYWEAIPGKLNPEPTLGVVLGMFVPAVERFEVGFIQAAKMINPEIEVLSVTAGSFTDQASGRESALATIEQGADIVFHAAGLTGMGAIQAADDSGVLAIGVDIDQHSVAPDTVITSAVKNIPESVYAVLESVKNNTFEGGTHTYGMADGATGIAPFHGFDDLIPQAVKDAVDDYEARIISGEIKVVRSRAELEEWMAQQ